MLHKKEFPQNFLLNAKNEYADRQFEYWTYEVDARAPYSCHLFTIVCNGNAALSDCWEDLTENIAINFQINLEREIERWNIYLLFLLENEVPKEIKYKVEQDKYCCRKLVEDNLKTSEFSEAYISQLIQDKIFSVRQINSDKTMEGLSISRSVETIIQAANGNILPALKDFKSNKHISPFYLKFKGLNNGE
ncbi:ABC-three component system middle component 1 [Chitinophaga sp. GbtcB8]|uniref:ABC-three component system middle component 1 n=1 Tax=Chitinophaga sp. GbtcB8 TaxID=2824753 RepID=UPI001C2F36A8|nr:ABC-three component system middle component 1 [Chitinophaga sp. GbtcB8]